MHQSVEGLELRDVSGRWAVAPVRPDALVVILGERCARAERRQSALTRPRRVRDTSAGDVLERMTNGVLRATPHRVPLDGAGGGERYSIIRFCALAAHTRIAPMEEFVTPESPALYSATTMEEHLRVTVENLLAGRGAWDSETDASATATYDHAAARSRDEL